MVFSPADVVAGGLVLHVGVSCGHPAANVCEPGVTHREELAVRLSLEKWRELKQFGDGPTASLFPHQWLPCSPGYGDVFRAQRERSPVLELVRRTRFLEHPSVLAGRLVVNPNPNLPQATETFVP